MGTHPIFESDFDCLTVTESIEHDSMKKSEISAFFKPLTEKTYNSGPHKTKNKTESQTYEEYCEENVIDKSAETTEDSSDNEPIQRASYKNHRITDLVSSDDDIVVKVPNPLPSDSNAIKFNQRNNSVSSDIDADVEEDVDVKLQSPKKYRKRSKSNANDNQPQAPETESEDEAPIRRRSTRIRKTVLQNENLENKKSTEQKSEKHDTNP